LGKLITNQGDNQNNHDAMVEVIAYFIILSFGGEFVSTGVLKYGGQEADFGR
jgi:hypothetical protein